MIHHVYANQQNIGDWLSARGIQSLLTPLPVEEHLCDEPFVPETLGRLATLGSADLIVIGGGGLFMQYFVPFWEGLLRLPIEAPVCIWGVGYCDLKSEPSRPTSALLDAVVHRSALCVVRDDLTRRTLARVDLPTPVACPSVCVIERASREGRGLLHVDNNSTAGAHVAEAIRRFGEDFARRTGRPYQHTNNRVQQRGEVGLARVLDRYAASDLVVSSALHGCIVALAMGRRVVAVSGDRKIEAFMHAAGLAEWVLNVDEVSRLPERLEALETQATPSRFLEAEAAKNRSVALRVRELAEVAANGRGIGSP